MLADLGAEVIKIEERDAGDPGRGITAVAGSATVKSGRNFYFEANNRHKKSIALESEDAGGARDRPQAGDEERRLRAEFPQGRRAPARARLRGPALRTIRE